MPVNLSDKFDEIRSFRDDEINPAIQRLTTDPYFVLIISKLYPNQDASLVIGGFQRISSIYEFQSKVISEFTQKIISGTIKKLTFSGLENLSSEKAYTFISTHRDIVLDSALLNHTLHSKGFKTTEIAIGGNLLIFDWIKTLVRMNRSFIVRRDLQGKEMFTASQTLSEYIRKKIAVENTSVWIAQREGRTKDGNDATQVALLKMLNLSGQNSVCQNFAELNIVPLTISYEFETCISHKIKEVYTKRQGKEYTKTKEDDLQSMGQGIFGKKGEVHISFGKPITDELSELNNIPKTNDKFEALKYLIDKHIHLNYYLTEGNYIGHDLFFEKTDFFEQGKYTQVQKDKFLRVAFEKVAEISGNQSDLLQIFYEIYAMPIQNKLKYVVSSE